MEWTFSDMAVGEKDSTDVVTSHDCTGCREAGDAEGRGECHALFFHSFFLGQLDSRTGAGKETRGQKGAEQWCQVRFLDRGSSYHCSHEVE